MKMGSLRTQFIAYMLLSTLVILVVAISTFQWLQIKSAVAVVPSEASLMTTFDAYASEMNGGFNQVQPAVTTTQAVQLQPATQIKLEANQKIEQLKKDIVNLTSGRYMILLVCVIILQLVGSLIWINRTLVKPMDLALEKIESLVDMDYELEEVADSNHEMAHLSHQLYLLSDTLKRHESEKTQEADRRKSIIAGISHDLKTPLTNICGYAETLLLEDGLAEVHKEWLQVILRNAYDANGLINDLQELNKYDMTTYPMQLSPINASEVIQEVLEDLAVEMKEKAQEVIVKGKAGPLDIETDQTLFKRLIKNIVSNFMNHAGMNTTLEVIIDPSNTKKILIFKDNGVGVAIEDLPFLTEMFYMSDHSRTNRDRSGLGLYNCNQIVRLLGWHLTFVSGLGQGFEVQIDLQPNEVKKSLKS